MENHRQIQDLADELLDDILSFVLGSGRFSNGATHSDPHDDAQVNGNFPHRYGEESDLDRFRLVCKRFMRISTPRKFSRFILRFSRDGFKRLEDLLNMQLACHVRHLTYMVRPLYQGNGWTHLLSTRGPETAQLCRRIQDQSFLVESDLDLIILRRAMVAFPSLQQIKMLRLQDETDEKLLEYIAGQSQTDTVCLNWEPACTRAVTILAVSLLNSTCSSIRFMAPQICPEAALNLLKTPPSALSTVGARLTSFEINFHSTTDMTPSMRILSRTLHNLFLATENLTALHIGFPAALPLNLRLDQVFHRVHWKRLRTLSLQGWRLHSTELIKLLRRYSTQLQALRLLNIYLRDGGKWADVIVTLHDEMEQLERIDLREIDYENGPYFDYSTISTNNNNTINPSPQPITLTTPTPTPRTTPNKSILPIDLQSFSHQPNPLHSLPASTLKTLRAFPAANLEDDGVSVSCERRLFWELWVLARPRDIVRRWWV